MNEDKKILINVEVKSKVDEAVKEVQSLNQHIDELTAKQRDLQRQGKENSDEFIKNSADIKALKNEVRSYNNILIANSEQQDRQQQAIKSNGMSMNEMSARLTALKNVYRNLSETERQSQFGKNLLQEAAQINSQLKELEQSYGQFGRNVGNYNEAVQTATTSLKQELRNLTEEMARLKLAGLDTSEEYQQMAQRAGDLKDAMADVSQQTNNIASDTANLDVMSKGVNGLMSSVAAFNVVLSMTGNESKELNKIMKNLQLILVLVNAATQIMNTTQKQSIVMIKARQLWTKLFTKTKKEQIATEEANVTTTAAETVAVNVNTKAVQKATLWQRLWNAAMKASVFGAIFGGIQALVWLFDRLTKKQSESAKAQEELNKKTAEFNSKIAESISEALGKVTSLKAGWDRLGNSLSEKKKFVKDNQKAFEDLGVSIKNVNEAEKFFSTKGLEAFKNSVIARAKIAAIQEQINKNVATSYKEEQQSIKAREQYNELLKIGLTEQQVAKEEVVKIFLIIRLIIA